MLKPYQGKVPEVHPTAFVEESAQVIGDVSIGEDASIWHNAVLRGDINSIRIGARTNIQDGCVLHVTSSLAVEIEHDVTVGHNAVIHGCCIHAHCLIGMGAIILDHAEIGENCIVGAGTVVKEGEKVPPNSLIIGVPGEIKRRLTEKEVYKLRERSQRYVEYKKAYMEYIIE